LIIKKIESKRKDLKQACQTVCITFEANREAKTAYTVPVNHRHKLNTGLFPHNKCITFWLYFFDFQKTGKLVWEKKRCKKHLKNV
jgi:3,4-dihydroxy-2-butanone 4-phosphate synthase